MLKHGQVLEVHGRLFGGYLVIDRYTNEAGELELDRYECANDDELLGVLDALGCDFLEDSSSFPMAGPRGSLRTIEGHLGENSQRNLGLEPQLEAAVGPRSAILKGGTLEPWPKSYWRQ